MRNWQGNIKDILNDTLSLLEGCPAACDRSCESCLRHYHNQHLKERLDRRMGAQLLRHVLTGRIPEELPVQEQARALSPLKRLLELDGFVCQSEAPFAGKTVPVLISKGSKQLALGIRSGLLDASWNKHSLSSLVSSKRAVLLNEFILRRNLPDEHQLIRGMF